MQFLWKSQLKRGRGKLLPKNTPEKNITTRKERLASHEKKASRNYFLVVLLWILFFGTLFYLICFSSYLTITTYTIDGIRRIPETQFRDMMEGELSKNSFGLFSHRRFFLIQPKKLEELFRKQYPLIRAISVKRVFPDALTISVEERETIVLWCSADLCSHILEDGSVLPATNRYFDPENKEHTLNIIDESGRPLPQGEGVFEEGFVSQLLLLKQSLKDTLGIETEERILVSSRFANEFRLKTVQGFEIYVNTHIAPETSLTALALILDEIPKNRLAELRYIDLRTENRVFYLFNDTDKKTEDISSLPSSEKQSNEKIKEKQ